MRQRLIRFSFTCALLALPVCALSGHSGNSSPNSSPAVTGEITDSICAPNGSHTAVMDKNPTMGRDNATCVKKCIQLGAQYVLYDPATKKVYTLDNQAQAAALAGHQVKVTGSLAGNNITVTSINPA
jgi:hypothetical protein